MRVHGTRACGRSSTRAPVTLRTSVQSHTHPHTQQLTRWAPGSGCRQEGRGGRAGCRDYSTQRLLALARSSGCCLVNLIIAAPPLICLTLMTIIYDMCWRSVVFRLLIHKQSTRLGFPPPPAQGGRLGRGRGAVWLRVSADAEVGVPQPAPAWALGSPRGRAAGGQRSGAAGSVGLSLSHPVSRRGACIPL